MPVRPASAALSRLQHQATDAWCRDIERRLGASAGQDQDISKLQAQVTFLQAAVAALTASAAALTAANLSLAARLSSLASHASLQDATANALCDWDTQLLSHLPPPMKPALPVPPHVPPLPSP